MADPIIKGIDDIPRKARLYYPQARATLQVIFDGFGGDDSAPKTIHVMPKQVTIHRNSYVQPDSWDLTFDAHDLPIDPDLIRSGQVEICLYSTEGLVVEGAPGQEGVRLICQQESTPGGAQRKPGETIYRERDPASWPIGSDQPDIVGLFDETGMTLDSSGQWVTISGQDYTAYLIGRQWPPRANGRPRPIPTGQRIDRMLEAVLREADPNVNGRGGNLRLVVEGIEAGDLPTVKRGGIRGRRGIPVEQGTTYWDVMFKVAQRSGLILFVRGLEVVLTRPQNLGKTNIHRMKRMAWGRNLERLELKRNLGKEKVPRIVVKAYDEVARSTVTVEYPKKAQPAPVGTLGVSEDEFQIVEVDWTSNRQDLEQIARARFDALGRAERIVRFSTKDLQDLESRDLLRIASGDPMLIEFDEFNVNRGLLSSTEMSPETKFQHLITRGFGAEVARILASKYLELQSIKRPLRVHEVSISYSEGQGITIEGELRDYITADGTRGAGNKASRASQRTVRKVNNNVSRQSSG